MGSRHASSGSEYAAVRNQCVHNPAKTQLNTIENVDRCIAATKICSFSTLQAKRVGFFGIFADCSRSATQLYFYRYACIVLFDHHNKHSELPINE